MLKKLLISAFIVASLPAFASENPMCGPELKIGSYSFNIGWNPTKITHYENDNATSWTVDEVSEYTYTPDGQVATEIRSDGQGNPLSKAEYSYDSYDPTLVVKKVVSNWNGTSWGAEETKELDIIRNDAGYIIVAEEKESGNVKRMEVEYGEDNCPVKIVVISDYGTPDAKTGVYFDLIWNRFNGKSFVFFEDLDNFVKMIPTNYSIKQAYYLDEDIQSFEEYTQSLYVKFSGTKNRDFEYRFVEIGKYIITQAEGRYTSLDEYGSFEFSEYEIQDDADHPATCDSYEVSTRVEKDMFGLVLNYMNSTYMNKKETHSERCHYAVGYDADTGFPIGYSNNRTDKYLFSGEDSGVTGIELDTNLPTEYFTIDGVPVVEPADGIYIVRQGDKVFKVLK